MNMTIKTKILCHVVVLTVIAMLTACSTTKRLEPGEILYTGVKKVEIVTPDGITIPSGLVSNIKEAVNVAPNNCLISPSIRYPFPLGLWVYNNWDNPPKGFKHWIYEKLVEEPVLISDVRPAVRTQMIDGILDDNGYFSGSASYTLIENKKNNRKARILYTVHTGNPYPLDSIILLPDTCRLNATIDSIARLDKYLRVGSIYSIDSLQVVRTRITNSLRDRGYYFFRPDYIEYLADSILSPGKIALKMVLVDNIPPHVLQRYKTGEITVNVYRNQGGGTPDTFQTRRATLVQMMPSRLRRDLIDESVAFRQGRTFTVRAMNQTQTYLSRLGIFNAINIDAIRDTLASSPTLNVVIDCTIDAPMEASIEANATSKSNSYLGPGIILGLNNRNLFGGGEVLSTRLTGSYEWQTGSDRSSIFNSYEVGLSASLSFPRLIAPRFIPRRRRNLNWTKISLNADLLNRPHYFKMAQFNVSYGYDWQATRHVSNSFTLFRLTYTNLIHTTAVFDSITQANPAIAQSFRSQFIPQMSYTWTYDRAFNRDNTLNATFTVREAGNLFWAIWEACGKKGEKRMFGTPFSQFVKGFAQVVYGRRLKGENWLWTRIGSGAAHAYGNSTQVPYSEQFYVGGANSVRAFPVRSLGPGSYHAPANQINGYFDQTGTFLFEFNVEYRFPIIGPLHGALFLDSGNVWLLRDDPARPGGLLQGKTFFKDLALGTGAGLRVDISMLVVRLDLGVGIHAPYATSRHGYYNMESFGKSLALHLAIGYPF